RSRCRYDRPAPSPGRPLERRLSVRAPPSARAVLRGELAPARYRCHRYDGSERGLVPTLEFRGDLRLLRACPRRDLAAVGPGAVLWHVRLRGGEARRAPVRVAAVRSRDSRAGRTA